MRIKKSSLLFLLFFLTVAGYSQPCFERFFEEGKAAFQTYDFDLARRKFLAAKLCDDIPAEQDKEVDKWIQKTESELKKTIIGIFDSLHLLNQALKDSDEDGVIDAMDAEPDTPPGAPVDTRGVSLDSDRDGVPDHLDDEPFTIPKPGEVVDSRGVIQNPIVAGTPLEKRLFEMLEEEAARRLPVASSGFSDPMVIFPMIHFATGSNTVKYSDYPALAGIAQMMKSHPYLRIVVTGFTDKTGNESYNLKLSYLRAQAAIDYFMNNHGIDRGRLLLQYRGQADALVPLHQSLLNRRVEFRIAEPGDGEMEPPGEGE